MKMFISVRWLLCFIPILLVGCGSGERGESVTLQGKASFNERPLAGVTVTAVPTAQTAKFVSPEEATTDDLGNFLFSDLMVGNYEVVASRDGYSFSPNKFAVVLKGGQEIADANFAAIKVGAPSAPATLAAKEGSAGVALHWEATGDKTLAYSVFRTNVGEPFPATPVMANISDIFCIDRTAEAGKTYTYAVTAFNANGESSFSSTVSVTPVGSEPLLGGALTTGDGGFIHLTNGTPYTWTRTDQSAYQMNNWDFPAKMEPGDSSKYYIEFNTSSWVEQSTTSASVTYTLGDTGLTFSISASVTEVKGGSFFLPTVTVYDKITVDYTGLNFGGFGSVDLGTVNPGTQTKEVFLVGEAGNFPSLTAPIDWMQSTLDLIGKKKLGKITIPGSHDAAMSTLTGYNFGTTENTLTQRGTIYEQLVAGSRYIDLRPVYREIDGYFTSGHYQGVDLNDALTKAYQWLLTQHGPDLILPTDPTIPWLPTVDLGGTGQSIADIIDDVNRFTKQHKELVILNLSHSLYLGADFVGRNLTQDEWDALLQQLDGLQSRFFVDTVATPIRDLGQLTLNEFLKPQGKPSAAVVVLVDADVPITVPDGFYPADFFNVFNCYSNTDNSSTMVSYQGKVLDAVGNYSNYSLASWTLTMPAWKAAMSSVATLGGVMDNSDMFLLLAPIAAETAEAFGTILELADEANTNVTDSLMNLAHEHNAPNIIYFDSITNIPAGQLAMALNYSFPMFISESKTAEVLDSCPDRN
jgi:hypothetical protein